VCVCLPRGFGSPYPLVIHQAHPESTLRLLPERTLRRALQLASLVVFALGWEWAARRIHSLLLPGFFATLRALLRLVISPVLWNALWVSNQAMLLGFALGTLVGVALGLLMGRWQLAEKFVDPYLSILLATPMSALIPIIIMATGLGMLSRVLIVFSFAVVVITVNTRAGLRGLDPDWVEMARSFGATEKQMWRKILLRGALPSILTGLRLGLARAISGMLMVELVLLALGIGRLILDFQGSFESAELYATVLVIIAEAVLLMQGCKWLERRSAPWLGQVTIE
jgi:ABC-type nitrate/sulfonate/bicarbonate transport system permease component